MAVYNPRIWMLDGQKMSLSMVPGNPPVVYVRPSVWWPVPEWDGALYDLYKKATSPPENSKAN